MKQVVLLTGTLVFASLASPGCIFDKSGLSGHAAGDSGAADGMTLDSTVTLQDGSTADSYIPVCGNHILDPGEACDDGNTQSGDGCSADCLSDESCGNGILDPGEECDDGNTDDKDACDECAYTHRCAEADYSGRTYLFCDSRVSWHDALDLCRQLGFDLASITDEAEDKWLGDTSSSISYSSWWIGLNDIDQEGTWVWSDGTPLGYTGWIFGQPDWPDEDCVDKSAYVGWNNLDCDEERRYICKKP